MTKRDNYEVVMPYVFLFLLFSFLGWVFEVIVRFLLGQGVLFDQGIKYLFGIDVPFLPIYGFGFLIIYFMSKALNKTAIKKNILLKSLILGVIISIFELLSGLLCKYVLKINFWDYSYHPLNLFGYISIISFSIWFILVLIFEYINETFKIF